MKHIKPYITISLYEDEWFFVSIKSFVPNGYYYYKCDQIQGVIDCLNRIYKT